MYVYVRDNKCGILITEHFYSYEHGQHSSELHCLQMNKVGLNCYLTYEWRSHSRRLKEGH